MAKCEYWKCYMDWPLDKNWNCETCGTSGPLTWGLMNGRCRCDTCHTQYMMRDYSKECKPIVNMPINKLRDKYKQPAREGWKLFNSPLSEWSDAQWDQAFAKAERNSNG